MYKRLLEYWKTKEFFLIVCLLLFSSFFFFTIFCTWVSVCFALSSLVQTSRGKSSRVCSSYISPCKFIYIFLFIFFICIFFPLSLLYPTNVLTQVIKMVVILRYQGGALNNILIYHPIHIFIFISFKIDWKKIKLKNKLSINIWINKLINIYEYIYLNFDC